jgi:histidine triad (HIT) family protein
VAGEIPSFKVHEDDHTISFMDINPMQQGHALIIPKLHSEDLFTTSDETLAAMMSVTRRVATAVKQALAPDGINIVQANGPGAAQSVFHVHFHVLPRKMGDNATLNWGLHPGDMDEISATAEKIRAVLEAEDGQAK